MVLILDNYIVGSKIVNLFITASIIINTIETFCDLSLIIIKSHRYKLIKLIIIKEVFCDLGLITLKLDWFKLIEWIKILGIIIENIINWIKIQWEFRVKYEG